MNITHLAATSGQDEAAAWFVLVFTGLVALVWTVVLVATIVSVARSENYSNAGKTGWILIVIGGIPPFNILAALLWFLWARKEPGGQAAEPPPGSYPPQPHTGTAYGPQGGYGYSDGYRPGY